MAKRSRHHLTDEEKRKLATLYKEGVPAWALAERFGVSRHLPKRIVKEGFPDYENKEVRRWG